VQAVVADLERRQVDEAHQVVGQLLELVVLEVERGEADQVVDHGRHGAEAVVGQVQGLDTVEYAPLFRERADLVPAEIEHLQRSIRSARAGQSGHCQVSSRRVSIVTGCDESLDSTRFGIAEMHVLEQ
jgi:hypothetical protein